MHTPALPAPTSDRSPDPPPQLYALTPVTPERHKSLSPTLLAYAMAPVALVILLAFRHWNVVAREPIWIYVAVLVVPMLGSLVANRWYATGASTPRLHLRVIAAATSVTIVIYLSGWGPVAVGRLRHHRRREHRPVRLQEHGGSWRCGRSSASCAARSPSGSAGRRRSCPSSRPRASPPSESS